MHSPKLLIVAVAAVSVVSAATFAFAQTTTPQAQVQSGNSSTTGTTQRDGSMANPSTSGTPGTSTQRAQDSTATGMGSSGNMGNPSTDRMQRDGSMGAGGMNSGSTTTQRGTMRSSTDGGTMPQERAARADRN